MTPLKKNKNAALFTMQLYQMKSTVTVQQAGHVQSTHYSSFLNIAVREQRGVTTGPPTEFLRPTDFFNIDLVLCV